MTALTIDVPATSANLGPGFDTLGLALDLVNTVHVELGEIGGDVLLCPDASDQIAADPRDNLLCRAYRLWSEDTGDELPGARFRVDTRIPSSRGLGSSAACIIAGLAAAAMAAGVEKPEERILRLATRLEGHPDNVAAALLGGVTVAFQAGTEVRAMQAATRLPLGVALFIPSDPLLTRDARGTLPSSVPVEDAVFDLGRLAYLVAALIAGRWEGIGPSMEDRLHQPYRARLLPALPTVITSAREAGAYGAALSGSGPSVIALCPPKECERIAAVMLETARAAGWEGSSLITNVREQGLIAHNEKK